MKSSRLSALDIQAVAFRRTIGSVSAARHHINTPRLMEAYWILIEAVVSAQRDEFVTQKQLVATADGVFSAPTISRAVHDLVEQGFLRFGDNRQDRRSHLLVPTAAARELLGTRAEVTVTLMRSLLADLDSTQDGLSDFDVPVKPPGQDETGLASDRNRHVRASGRPS